MVVNEISMKENVAKCHEISYRDIRNSAKRAWLFREIKRNFAKRNFINHPMGLMSLQAIEDSYIQIILYLYKKKLMHNAKLFITTNN
jgi:hypothetical protein